MVAHGWSNRSRARNALLHLLQAMSFVPGLEFEPEFLVQLLPFMMTRRSAMDFLRLPPVCSALFEARQLSCDGTTSTTPPHIMIDELASWCASTNRLDAFMSWVPQLALAFDVPERVVIRIARSHMVMAVPPIPQPGGNPVGVTTGGYRRRLLPFIFAVSACVCTAFGLIVLSWPLSAMVWVYLFHLFTIALRRISSVCETVTDRCSFLLAYDYFIRLEMSGVTLVLAVVFRVPGLLPCGVDAVLTAAMAVRRVRSLRPWCP